jgi:hypothetical protein
MSSKLTSTGARNPFAPLVPGIVVWLLRFFPRQGALVAEPSRTQARRKTDARDKIKTLGRVTGVSEG